MSDFRITIQISDMERRSLAAIVSAGNKMSAHANPPPDDADTDLAFGLADDVLQSVGRMRKSIARDKSIQDAQGLLRIGTAAVIYGQMIAVRERRSRKAAATAPTDKPIAYHTVMVEVFADATHQVRVESAAIEYDSHGDPLGPVGIEAYAPRGGRRTADEAAQDVLVGARLLAQALADGPLRLAERLEGTVSDV